MRDSLIFIVCNRMSVQMGVKTLCDQRTYNLRLVDVGLWLTRSLSGNLGVSRPVTVEEGIEDTP